MKIHAPLALLLFILYLSGTRGLYFFDSSIVFNYGWEIYRHKEWGNDFFSPLMPLVGNLISTGYRLFGVSYISAVYTNLIIATIFYYLVRAVIVSDRHTKTIHAFMFTYLIFGAWGIPAYNNISEALIVLLLLLAIRSGGTSETKFDVFFKSTLLFLLTTNKLFSGFIWTSLLCAIEILPILIRRDSFNGSKAMRNSLTYISIGLLLPFLIFGMGQIASSLYLGANLQNLLINFTASLAPAKSIFSNPEINLVWVATYFVILYISNIRKAIHSHYVILIGLIGHILMYVFSGDARSIDLAFIIFVIFVMEKNVSNSEVHNRTLRYSSASTATIISICIFSLFYGFYGMRKAQNELFEYIERSNLQMVKINSEGSFFKGIRVNFADSEMIKEIDVALDEHNQKKTFFGPGLEILYPATGNEQPDKWPIWLHKGVSYNVTSENAMKVAFSNKSYDLLVVSNTRIKAGFLDFLESEIKQNYKITFTGKYISLYERKSY